MSAIDTEIMAMYGALDEARKQQILDYRQELAEQKRAEQRGAQRTRRHDVTA
jgi:hypothetical protein